MGESGPRVLIVDDEAGIRRFLRASLEAKEYCVQEASSGEEALQVVPAFRPDLILLDLVLPGIGGCQVTSCLREWTQTPIIVLSARHSDQEKALLRSMETSLRKSRHSMPERTTILPSRSAMESCWRAFVRH